MTAEEALWQAIERVVGSRPVVLTVSEYGRILRTSKPTVYRSVAAGTLRAVRLAGSLRIPVSEVFRQFGLAEPAGSVLADVL